MRQSMEGKFRVCGGLGKNIKEIKEIKLQNRVQISHPANHMPIVQLITR